ncbi:MAG TPA: CopD family protein, partial [Telmatospirillum sp.]|nr:CopD family protein [Telmatospirillum sp.]
VAAMTDRATIITVLNGTAFGQVWRIRLVFAAVAAGLSVRQRGGGRRLLLVMAAFQVASLGWIGHAAMEEGMAGLFQRANQSVHLLAGGAWIGALPSILILLVVARNNAAGGEVETVLRRFSGYGVAAVVLLLISGMVNVWVRSGGRFLSLYGPYGQILLVKVLLVGGMIGLALANRALVAPVLSKRVPRRRIILCINVLVETLLGLSVLFAAFVLGNSPPP